ncbi:MAG: hypothetical protein M1812_006854 [Candelaria pacifica]|nr:MAG: hypothetical protein M1812_006854 [Candelaria pacifica]
MGGNRNSGSASADTLTVPRALEIARNSEDAGVDPTVTAILERAISEIWQRLIAHPESYVLSKEEFAVFNYFRNRFHGSEIAQRAVERFWNNFQGETLEIDGYQN